MAFKRKRKFVARKGKAKAKPRSNVKRRRITKGSRRAPGRTNKHKRASFRGARKVKKDMILEHMLKSIPAQSYLSSYVDSVQQVGTTNTRAVQVMWGNQQSQLSALALGSTTVPRSLVNLHLTPNVLMANLLAQNTQAGAGAITAQILLRDCAQKCRMTNLSTGSVIITEYRVRARHDQIQAASGANSTCQVSDVITNGFADASSASGTGDAVYQTPLTSDTYGATPFMNPRFVQQYKVIKVRKFELQPGKSKVFGYKTLKPRVIKNEDFNQGVAPFLINPPAGQTAFKQVSKGQSFSVFQAQGTIASSIEATAAVNNIGVGNITIGMIYETKMHYSIIAPANVYSHGSTRIPGFSAGVASFPAPLVITHPDSAVSTGPVPAAAGTRTYALTANEPFSVRDAVMLDT